jgi:hypothetical protein
MEQRCVALKLLLDAVAIPSQIRTVADRKRVQKAVYLIQLTGVDLGYQYGWYLMGPYSPALTRDYYNLAAALDEGDNETAGLELRGPVRERVDSIKSLMDVPDYIKFDQPSWLELLTSVHYLQKVRGLGEAAADQELKKSKPTLAPWAFAARQELKNRSLLS